MVDAGAQSLMVHSSSLLQPWTSESERRNSDESEHEDSRQTPTSRGKFFETTTAKAVGGHERTKKTRNDKQQQQQHMSHENKTGTARIRRSLRPQSSGVLRHQRRSMSGEKRKKKKRMKMRNSDVARLRFGRLRGSLSNSDLRRFVETKGRVGNRCNVQTVPDLRWKNKAGSVMVEGDGLRTRQALSFIESMGGIQTRFTSAAKNPTMW
jgi:hypothetical protein